MLKDFKNTVAVLDMETGEREAITVYYLKTAHKKYRFSLDDNIWCLQNIAKNQHIYKSVFEDPYFKLLKTMNDRYGTKFHVNIYDECPEFGGFNLTQMPDKPYVRGTFAQTKFEHDRVVDQILRFAGEEAFAGPVTTIHWGDATVETVRAMRSGGIRAMMYFVSSIRCIPLGSSVCMSSIFILIMRDICRIIMSVLTPQSGGLWSMAMCLPL